MAPLNVLLVACGSFNPPTNMHLRIFEIARDHLERQGEYKVVGGVISPVHDAYKKNDLISSEHRCSMLKLALSDNDWVKLSDWECQLSGWSRTKDVLQYHQNQLNSALNANNDSPRKRHKRDSNKDEVDDIEQTCSKWMPHADVDGLSIDKPVRVMLLCGGDLLESFGNPNIWNPEDVEAIVGQHGVVVITRDGSNPYKFIYESDVLTKCMRNIIVVTEWITNDVSSTKIRRAIRRGESIKYLIPDAVARYIKQEGLFADDSNSTIANRNTTKNVNTGGLLTLSPCDVTMAFRSPCGATDRIGCTKPINTQIKPSENISRMAAFLGMEFGEGFRAPQCHELLLNEENTKKSSVGLSKQTIPKSSSRDSLDSRKVSLASMSSPKCTKHCKSVDDCKAALDIEPKVEIKITNDGILVISDKETTV